MTVKLSCWFDTKNVLHEVLNWNRLGNNKESDFKNVIRKLLATVF